MQILARVTELSEATRRPGDGRRRWIGVGYVPAPLYGVLPNVNHDFMRKHAELGVALSELSSVQQTEALKSGRIDVGYGRVRVDADGIVNRVIQKEPLVAVLAAKSALASQTVIAYSAQPWPSLADQVLAHFRARGAP